VEVEFSELPSIDPLTLEHMLGVYLIYSLMIVLATLAWLTEVCFNSVKRGKERVGRAKKIQAQESKPSVSADLSTKPNIGHLEYGKDIHEARGKCYCTQSHQV